VNALDGPLPSPSRQRSATRAQVARFALGRVVRALTLVKLFTLAELLISQPMSKVNNVTVDIALPDSLCSLRAFYSLHTIIPPRPCNNLQVVRWIQGLTLVPGDGLF
jgi:hypothetical protein